MSFDRCNCPMSEVHGGKVYCGYYDFACILCYENVNCPEEEEAEREEELEDLYLTDYDEDDY